MGNQEPGIKNEEPVNGRAAPSGLPDNRAVVRGSILSLTGSPLLIPGSRSSILSPPAPSADPHGSGAARPPPPAGSLDELVT